MYRQFKDIAHIHRQVKVDGKSSYQDTWLECTGYLHALSPERNQIAPEKYGKEFAFTTHLSVEIREADRLEIWGIFYRVKGVAPLSGVIIRHKRVNIVKEELWS